MNWVTHSKTDLRVGFIREGNDCEGGNCEHLQDQDTAYGQTSECDSFGSEVYLMCKKCYEEFMITYRTEPTECNDCGFEVPRNEGVSYTPYASECTHAERMNSRMFVCSNCKESQPHQMRLAQDIRLRDEDIQEMHDDEEDPWEGDDEPEDDRDDGGSDFNPLEEDPELEPDDD